MKDIRRSADLEVPEPGDHSDDARIEGEFEEFLEEPPSNQDCGADPKEERELFHIRQPNGHVPGVADVVAAFSFPGMGRV